MNSRKYRKRRKSSTDDESEGENSSDRSKKLSEVKDVQQMRCKRGGINALSLAAGRIVTAEEELSGKVFTKSTAPKEKERYGLQVGNTFFAESNQKEEDQLMNRYIQEELAKRRGQ